MSWHEGRRLSRGGAVTQCRRADEDVLVCERPRSREELGDFGGVAGLRGCVRPDPGRRPPAKGGAPGAGRLTPKPASPQPERLTLLRSHRQEA
jgi:hypothetical protein